MNARPPTFSVDCELRPHTTPRVRVFTSHTDNSTVTVACITGERLAVRWPLGFTLEILRCPKNATGTPLVSAGENTRPESARVNSRISMPVCAASTYSSNRWVANSWRLPFAFSTENVNKPMFRCGTRFNVGGSRTRWRGGRCDPPQPKSATRTKKQMATRVTRMRPSRPEGSGVQHNECRLPGGNLRHNGVQLPAFTGLCSTAFSPRRASAG